VFAVGVGPGVGWQQSCYGTDAEPRGESEAWDEDYGSIRDAAAKADAPDDFGETAQEFETIERNGVGRFMAVDYSEFTSRNGMQNGCERY